MTTSDDFIEQFIQHYAAHDAAYKTLSRKLESECRELCSQEGIKAVVSSRTKDKERLSDKIRKRASKKANGYGSLEEIKLTSWISAAPAFLFIIRLTAGGFRIL